MKTWFIAGLLAAIVAVPFLLRPKEKLTASAEHTLVIVSPHNEAIRAEFTRAFRNYCKASFGKDIAIDWRTPGGTSEVARYLESEYLAAFEFYWTRKLGKPFNLREKGAFANARVTIDDTPGDDTPEQTVRRAFLTSNVSSGIDLFFGGGSFDFAQQASRGVLVDGGVKERHPEWFGPDGIPQERGGEFFYDEKGRWYGACLSAFGICYNVDSLKALKLEPPTRWSDLGDPRYNRQIALADPTKSGSITKAFEMIIQQQIHEAGSPATPETIALGWERALQLIQRVSANARYFTDSAPKVPLDVSSGDAAAGMCIDFYGRFQSEAVRRPDGSSRLLYVSPENGTSVGSDPIGLLRGAPNPELAKQFIDFVLSKDGQKLWNFNVGTPGGPHKYQLRRLPIRPDLYAEKYRSHRSDPEVNPYAETNQFDYQASWTGSLFRQIGFGIRALCIDPQEELHAAWAALIEADFPPEASRVFSDLSALNYDYVRGEMRDILSSPDKINEVRLAKDLSEHFRRQYRETIRLAKAGK